MRQADWIQTVIGSLGVLATLGVAWMVYRLEKKERKADKAESRALQEKAHKEAQERERQTHLDQKEREQRELRRMQHQDDYRAAREALNSIDGIFEKVSRGSLLTRSQAADLRLVELGEKLKAIGKRVERLYPPLTSVVYSVSVLDAASLPDERELSYALRSDGVDNKELYSVMKRSIEAAVVQYETAKEGLAGVKKARDAIAKEWGS
ncbi:hypothetical protein AB0L00_05005 [Actinoallomurus sp. NPDC052308]|uniref:hypothetical protein n=1 Tax=Actinoallomurus sp. NPDC052308 TaxID=3155530 RepID=UPI003445DD25